MVNIGCNYVIGESTIGYNYASFVDVEILDGFLYLEQLINLLIFI